MDGALKTVQNTFNKITTKVSEGVDEFTAKAKEVDYKEKYNQLVESTAERDFLIASISIVSVLGLAGLYPIKFSQRGLSYMHVVFGLLFVVSVILGIYLQFQRVKRRKRLDWVVWTHIAIYGLMSYLGVLATAKHARKLSKMSVSEKGSKSNTILYVIIALVLVILIYQVCWKKKSISFDDIKLSSESNQIIATYKGNKYDLTEWAPQHPGGSHFIKSANGKDLQELWEARGLTWHMDEQWIMDILEKYKIE